MIASIGEKNFRDEVLNSPIPVLVNFWTPWCGPCRVIEPLVIQVRDSIPQAVKIFRVNADENFWLAKNFHLTQVPTVLLFHQGQVVHRLEQVSSREEVLDNLRTALRRIRWGSAERNDEQTSSSPPAHRSYESLTS